MPVTTDNMVTPEDLTKWPYLAKVNIPSLKANVDLLIGTNAPRLLEPWEVINSCENGPYAVKTVLGWIVNGPLNGNSGALETELPSATVNRISVCKSEEKLIHQYNHNFNEKRVEEKDNPDDVSRGMKISDLLKNSRWIEGSAFLWKHEEDWPKTVLEATLDPNDQEVRKEVTANVINKHDVSRPVDQLIAYFSDWRRLKTAVA